MRHARNMRALDRMVEIGMSMLEALGCDAREGASGFPVQRNGSAHPAPPDPAQHHGEMALAFHRASRAVRLAIAMQNRLIEEAEVQTQTPARTAPAREGLEAIPPQPGHSARLHAAVQRRARAAGQDDEAAVQRLLNCAAEQLSERESFAPLLNQPFEAVMEQICRDLGLPAPPGQDPASGADPRPPNPAPAPLPIEGQPGQMTRVCVPSDPIPQNPDPDARSSSSRHPRACPEGP